AIYKTQAKQLPTFDAALEHLQDDQVQQLSDMHVQIMQENQRQAEVRCLQLVAEGFRFDGEVACRAFDYEALSCAGPCEEVAYIADFSAEEKEDFEEVCKVCFCKLARGNGQAGVAQNAPLAASAMTPVSAEPRPGDVGKGSDNGPIPEVKA
ncbi:unnamed protein product, partial [Symbiodinium sp. CCMP2456]